MIKKIFVSAFAVCIICILIPLILGAVFLYEDNTFEYKSENIFNDMEVFDAEIYIEDDNSSKDIEEIINYDNIDYTENNLEEYITGVVAAEMPVSFRFEALKAQAVASRTYTLKHTNNYNKINSESIGQAFISISDMKKRWQSNFENNYKKIKSAVYSTRGIIMEYNGEPIEAVFHSTSAGITENAENVWGKELPYIKSVKSDLDKNAPNFVSKSEFNKNEFENKIKENIKSAKKLDNMFDNFKITKRSEAGYVLEVDLGGVSVKGNDIRTALGLRSTDFEFDRNDKNIIFTTKGYGHGAGMSQYGAEFMAREGKNFEEILKHYYSGIEITSIN